MRPLKIQDDDWLKNALLILLCNILIEQEIQLRKIKVNLIGVALGNAWISPVDYVINYADFAFWMVRQIQYIQALPYPYL